MIRAEASVAAELRRWYRFRELRLAGLPRPEIEASLIREGYDEPPKKVLDGSIQRAMQESGSYAAMLKMIAAATVKETVT